MKPSGRAIPWSKEFETYSTFGETPKELALRLGIKAELAEAINAMRSVDVEPFFYSVVDMKDVVDTIEPGKIWRGCGEFIQKLKFGPDE